MDPLEELIRAQPGLSIALAVLGLVVGSFFKRSHPSTAKNDDGAVGA